MRGTLAGLNLLIGAVYTSYGFLTIRELLKERHSRALSHFGLAWVAMAFTCGPHHLDHGAHLLIARGAVGMELPALLLGLAPGLGWFALRLEALAGGRGDREIGGTPTWLRVFVLLHVVAISAVGAWIIARGIPVLSRDVLTVPNILLVALYAMIAAYLLHGQFTNHAHTGGWSASGIALTLVFATCALMHAAYVAGAAAAVFPIDQHGLAIGWLGVPAAMYFLWVVRGIQAGTLGQVQLGQALAGRRAAG